MDTVQGRMTESKTETQTDRQTDRQIDGQTGSTAEDIDTQNNKQTEWNKRQRGREKETWPAKIKTELQIEKKMFGHSKTLMKKEYNRKRSQIPYLSDHYKTKKRQFLEYLTGTDNHFIIVFIFV